MSAATVQPPMQTDDTRSTAPVHSGRLIYAKPQDLPSFPVVGVKSNGSAASAAASLGWANQKSPELWKPNKSPSAAAAAMLAKDHKTAPSWTPSPSAHGAQAALLAHKAAKSSEAWKPSATQHGHSAANQAFKADRNPQQKPRSGTLNQQRSLMAAKGAMTTRPRAKSTPVSKEAYPDELNAATNAMKAATRAHNPVRAPIPTKGAGASPYVHMNPQMFTSHPPVKAEVDEKNREDQLHASAVAMAKKMFSQQQKVIDQAKKSQARDPTAPRHRRSSNSSDDDVPPMQFGSLQDAAYKLAQERLSKLHEENLKNRDYQDYYGQGKSQRKFSIRGKLRRRSSSDGDIIEDRQRSQQIRKEMSIFSNKLSLVDDKKRQHDRDALLAAAQRNVQARLKGMDEKITAETGMVQPARFSDWEVKAHAAAQARSDNRLSKHGKVDLGAGKYMDQEEIDAIAARRVQPVLDEINEKAEKEQARQTELRLEAEAKKDARELEKSREKEVQDISKMLKEQDKHEQKEKRAEEKQEAKAKREEEKAAKAEQKRLAKSERHKSAPPAPIKRDEPREDDVGADEMVALNDAGQPVRVPTLSRPLSTIAMSKLSKVEIPADAQEHQPKSGPSSPGKVKTWFKSRFSRGSKSDDEKPKSGERKGFVGGAALTGLEGNNDSTASVENRNSSMRDIAMAGRGRIGHSHTSSTARAAAGDEVSPMSSSSDDEFFRDEAGITTILDTPPPRPLQDPAARKSASPVRDSRFHELI